LRKLNVSFSGLQYEHLISSHKHERMTGTLVAQPRVIPMAR
jgi:hypothetical protein